MKERKFILVIPSCEIGTDDETLDSKGKIRSLLLW
jgi:hypothetical protein